MHLLDTPIVLALRNARSGTAEPGLTAWASRVAHESLFISAITLHELEEQARASAQDRSRWRSWIDDHVMRAFDGRVLPIDIAVVRRAGQLERSGARDGLLAATALEHGLTLVTLRPRAFKASRARTFDPTGFAPSAQVEDWRQATQAAPAWIKNLFVRG